MIAMLIALSTPLALAEENGTFKNLGVQLTSSMIQGSTFSRDSTGRELVFTVMRGQPAKLLMLDARTGAFLKSFALEDAHGAWNACTATDNSVYVGTDDNGHLYRYIPGESDVQDLGLVHPNQTFVWDVTPGVNGEVFLGTYPAANVIRYHPADGFTEISRGAAAKDENYVRSVAFDPASGKVYAGIGAHAHLIEIDPKTGEKTNILPEKFAGQTMVYGLDVVGGKIFASITDLGDTAVFDAKTRKLEAMIPKTAGQLPVSPIEPGTSHVYLASGPDLVRYDLNTATLETVLADRGGGISAFTWMDLNVDGLKGQTLVAMTRHKKLLRFNPATGKSYYLALGDMPSEPTPMQSIVRGPDRNIYSSGYLIGGLAVYDVRNDTSRMLGALGQAEDITRLGDMLYFGIYPRARLFALDVTEPYTAKNPRQFASLDEHHQDRPMAMLGVPELGDAGKLFIGTIPDYGLLGGAFSIYDVKRDELKVHRNIVKNQSVVDLIFDANTQLIYGTTSISGGLGIKPSAKEAFLFAWDDAKEEKVFEIAPIPGAHIITALMIGPDGNLWGISDGTLFVFDPKSREVVSRTVLRKKTYADGEHAWRHAWLETAPDGSIYGVMGGKLFRVDPETSQWTILREKGANLLAIDDESRVYFKDGVNLMQYAPPR